ncbi:MAG TPA: TetR/AcrR family transcriptional regulator, partial [Spirochaetota bacterium]|nr:TetR/AcrR family transcriptional regulator [Spirochaetota bacterium]
METNKKEIKKEEIIKIAFSEWGKSGFRDMSLSVISEKMKITKAGLYRYFKDKEEIINSLIDYFLHDYMKISDDFIEKNKNNENLEDFIYNYINSNFSFFAINPEYLFFYASSMMMVKILKNNSYIKQKTTEIEIFTKLFEKSKSWIKNDNIIHFMNHLFETGLFLLFHSFG